MHLLRDTIAKSSSLGVTVMPGFEGSFRIYSENGIVMIEFFGWMTESLLEVGQPSETNGLRMGLTVLRPYRHTFWTSPRRPGLLRQT